MNLDFMSSLLILAGFAFVFVALFISFENNSTYNSAVNFCEFHGGVHHYNLGQNYCFLGEDLSNKRLIIFDGDRPVFAGGDQS